MGKNRVQIIVVITAELCSSTMTKVIPPNVGDSYSWMP
jgi:hypothetical protein